MVVLCIAIFSDYRKQVNPKNKWRKYKHNIIKLLTGTGCDLEITPAACNMGFWLRSRS